jgi:hypothetical protein
LDLGFRTTTATDRVDEGNQHALDAVDLLAESIGVGSPEVAEVVRQVQVRLHLTRRAERYAQVPSEAATGHLATALCDIRRNADGGTPDLSNQTVSLISWPVDRGPVHGQGQATASVSYIEALVIVHTGIIMNRRPLVKTLDLRPLTS